MVNLGKKAPSMIKSICYSEGCGASGYERREKCQEFPVLSALYW